MATYSLSCLTKHSGDFWILLLGRLLGGVSTSLLFSAFESWLVAEHFSRGYSESLLNETFSKAVFLGAGLMAIISGLVGNVLVENLKLGPVSVCGSVMIFHYFVDFWDRMSRLGVWPAHICRCGSTLCRSHRLMQPLL